MKKKIVTMLMVLSVASLCACGNTETTTSDEGTTDAVTVDETALVADPNESLPDPVQALAKALEDGDTDAALSYAIETGNAEVARALSNGDLEQARAIFNGSATTYDANQTTIDSTDASEIDYNFVTSEYVTFVDMKTPAEQLEYIHSVAVEHNLEFVADENVDELTVSVVNAPESVTVTLNEDETNGDVVIVLSEENNYSVTFTTRTGSYALKSLVNSSGEEIDCDKLYEKVFPNGDPWSDKGRIVLDGKATDAICTFTCK